MGSPFAADDRNWKNAHAAREAAQERAAYAAEMREENAREARFVAAAASPAAVDYLRNLMIEKAVSTGTDAEFAQININAWIARNGSKSVVSANIDRLKAEGFTGRTSTGSHAKIETVVPAGRYAVETESGATNALAFYKVDRPTEGRWAGRVFVKLIVSDDEQRLSWATSKSVLAKIAEVGPEIASARYGHEIGKCGVCSKTLTNDVSRERGIGPKCAAKLGW